MKQTKKPLALLLAVALGLALAAPTAFAQEDSAGDATSTVDWSDFYFITQPQETIVAHGSDSTLSVEVNCPEGAEVVSYEWYSYSGSIIAGTGQTLCLSPGDDSYPVADLPYLAVSRYYYCVIKAVEVDEEGNPVGPEWETSSLYALVTVGAERKMTGWETVKKGFTNFLAVAFFCGYIGLMWLIGILLAPYHIFKALFG